MDTLSKDLDLMKSNDWTIILDLSDAYLQVPIFKTIQTISVILHSMENTLCRPHRCTHNSSIIAVSEHQNSGLFRRLVSSKSVTQILSSRSKKLCQTVYFSGIYNKHRKVKCSTQIVFSLSRGQFDLAQ